MVSVAVTVRGVRGTSASESTANFSPSHGGKPDNGAYVNVMLPLVGVSGPALLLKLTPEVMPEIVTDWLSRLLYGVTVIAKNVGVEPSPIIGPTDSTGASSPMVCGAELAP